MNVGQWIGQMLRKWATPMRLLGPGRDGMRQYSGWDTAKAVREGFDQSVWVRACVEIRMDAMARLPWKAYEKQGKEWVEAPGHPLETLMEHPNSDMEREELIGLLEAHLCLGGNGLLDMLCLNSGPPSRTNPPVELWPIDPTGITYVPSKTDFIRAYQYTKDGVDIPIPAEGVLHFRCTNPGDMRWGSSPLKSASRAVDTEIAAQKWNVSLFANRAMPQGLLSLDAALSPEDWERAREELAHSQAGPENARRTMVIGAGAKYEALSWSTVDLDYLEGRKFSLREICAAYRVPVTLVTESENATLANVDSFEKQFWNQTIVPRMDKLAGVLNRELVPFFGKRESLKLMYDTSAIEALREDMDTKSQIYERLVKNGIPPNEAAAQAQIKLDKPIPGGDIGYMPATMTPTEMLGDLAEETVRGMAATTDTTLHPPKDPNKQPKPPRAA
jgi:HK97 family phage portal protein